MTTCKLPNYLVELTKPTPSGVAKLIAAWDGLSAETQIQLFSHLSDTKLPAYLDKKFHLKAIESENPYVRYLAARSLYIYDDSDEDLLNAKAKIESDAEPLVRYSLDETESEIGSTPLRNPEEFFSFPQERRLAMVRCLYSNGEDIASLVRYAVNTDKVSEIELFEILADFLQSEKFQKDMRESSIDGFHEHMKGNALTALWQLVPDVPEAISHVLLQHLPEEGGLSSGPGSKLLNSLSVRQWNTLLFRDDIRMTEWRKKFFFDDSDTDILKLKFAAVSRHFDLSEEEFEKILKRPPDKRDPLLLVLAQSGWDIRFVFQQIVIDYVKETDHWEEAHMLGDRLDYRLREARKNPKRYKYQIHELRLYRLAKQLTRYDPSDELSFIKESIEKDDLWQTYKNLTNKWSLGGRLDSNPKLHRLLPNIDEFDGYDHYDDDEWWREHWADEEKEEETSGLVERISSRVKSIIDEGKPEDDDRYDDLRDLARTSNEKVIEAERVTNATINQLRYEMEQSRQAVSRLSFWLYLLIGIAILTAIWVMPQG